MLINFEGLQQNRVSIIDKLKYALSEVSENWNDRIWWKNRFLYYVVGAYFRRRPNRGIFIMNLDWDNLIILDACRYDIFCKVYGQKVNHVLSRGSNTVEFLLENFAHSMFKDTVYITTNPFVSKYCKSNFYRVIPLWDSEWDSELQTVPPDKVYERTLEFSEIYPDKKLIIHYHSHSHNNNH